MSGGILFLIVFFSVTAVFISIAIPIAINNDRYKKFIEKHSTAIKELNLINDKYKFNLIPNFDMKHSYDNENMYSDISCWDYLTYQLVYIQKDVNVALRNTLINKKLFDEYKKEIQDICIFSKYDTDEVLKKQKKLDKYERKLFMKVFKTPVVDFKIVVVLVLTNINGRYRQSKYDTFTAREIKDTIHRINEKRGNFYLNNDVWQSICRVERGKVTNRMRFFIYERDGYRCQICGRRTRDLEVDHIIPIAKGGKSTPDNLQTLCHRCNYRKGSDIIYH